MTAYARRNRADHLDARKSARICDTEGQPMPAGRADPEDHLVLVSFDLPTGLYVRACRAANRKGFPSLEAYALHLLRQLGGDETA